MKRAFQLSWAIGLGAIGLSALAHADPPPPSAASKATVAPDAKSSLTVIVEGFHSDAGDALFALFRTEQGFPKEPLKAAARQAAHISGKSAEANFTGLVPGDFAVSVLHDEDRDRKLKTGLFGIPSEGVGFSRNALGNFGPPSWEDAKMKLNPGVHLTIKLRMHYY
jgi:uncharacterized protein (DUF2141 family)